MSHMRRVSFVSTSRSCSSPSSCGRISRESTVLPTVVVTGPKGEQDFSQSLEGYGTYQSAINAVS